MKLLGAIDRKFNLHNNIPGTLGVLADYFFKYRHYNLMPSLRAGFEPHEPVYLPVPQVKRIADAYHLAKEQQKHTTAVYRVGKTWQGALNDQLHLLIDALDARDYKKLNHLFAGQQREEHGQTVAGWGDIKAYRNQPFAKYEYVNTFSKYIDMIKEMGLECYLAPGYPQAGNPVGIMTRNGYTLPIEAMWFAFVSSQLLALVKGVEHPVVYEIGGGQGGVAYYTVMNSPTPLTYKIFDIPEVLVLASYFLMAGCPEKKISLYGECGADADIHLLPNFALPLEDQTAHVFYNQRSFPEMEAETVQEYLRQIERLCTGYFYHVNYNNHEINQYGKGYVQSTDVIPDPAVFRLVIQYPWYFNRLVHEIRIKTMAFLYERIY